MNRLKYLFTYTIVIIIALTNNACRKDIPLILTECKSNCFEIRGVLWNASANKPEVNRRIDVEEITGGFYSSVKNYGFVVSDSNGNFIIKLNRSEIIDTVNLNIGLEIDQKSGYLNSSNFLQILPINYKLHEVNNILLYVYEEAYLTYNISSSVDSFYVYGLNTVYNSRSVNHNIFKQITPTGTTVRNTIITAAGLNTTMKLRYRKMNSTQDLYIYDDIVPLKDQNNSVSFDLK